MDDYLREVLQTEIDAKIAYDQARHKIYLEVVTKDKLKHYQARARVYSSEPIVELQRAWLEARADRVVTMLEKKEITTFPIPVELTTQT